MPNQGTDSTHPVPEATVERFEASALQYVDGDKGWMVSSRAGEWVRYEDYEKLEREFRELQQWKESQLSITPDWQEIGREIGLTLGDSVPDKILPWIRHMKELYAFSEGAFVKLWNQTYPESQIK